MTNRQAGTFFEALESRTMLNVAFDFDYSLDTSGFFNDPARRNLLEMAGNMLEVHLADSLDAIMPDGVNTTWQAIITNPTTGQDNFNIVNPAIGADTLKVFVGARPMTELGRGGAGGFFVEGDQAFINTVRARGEAGALGAPQSQTDFGPWGGAVAFDSDANWYFGASLDGLDANEADFLTVALHELAHVLGFSADTSSFMNLITGSTFTGVSAVGQYDGAGAPPLDGDHSHWAEGLMDDGDETLMDPSQTNGQRKGVTLLDLAALNDIGWDIDLTQPPVEPPTAIALSTLDGDGEATGTITMVGGSALFTFDSLAAGRAFVQVVSAPGLDAGVRVFNEQDVLVASNDTGHVAATAEVEFFVDAPGETYTIQVVGLSGVGAITTRVDAEPVIHYTYYPEGFANNVISEFVSITNPNDFAVTYSVTLRYEDPTLPFDEAVVAMNDTVAAGVRTGVTISDAGFRAMDILHETTIEKATPYAIIVTSDGPLAVSLAHYDFSIATGESFTTVTSDDWSFPRVERSPGEVNDFLVFYNPNDHAAVVTLTAITNDGQTVTFTQTVQPMRRSGWAINQLEGIGDGLFGAIVTSEAADPADQPSHIGIVAALTHFDTVNTHGWGALGDAGGGSSEGVIPSLTRTAGEDVQIAFLNRSSVPTVVTIEGSYITGMTPDFASNITLAPNSVTYRTGTDLGLAVDTPVGIEYSSLFGSDIVVQAQDTSLGDGTSTAASTVVGREFAFGDGFINANRAGELYFETLSFYNPAQADIQVTIDILFADGASASVTTTVTADGFTAFALHDLDLFGQHNPKANFFGLRLTSTSPFAVTMSHVDLFFGSGWTADGSAIGFLTPLELIA